MQTDCVLCLCYITTCVSIGSTRGSAEVQDELSTALDLHLGSIDIRGHCFEVFRPQPPPYIVERFTCMADSSKLRIAVVGAGIAGLAVAIALQKHDGTDVQIYERATQLQEIGASIALGPNGMRTLEKLGVLGALDDEVAFRNKSGYPMIYRYVSRSRYSSRAELSSL